MSSEYVIVLKDTEPTSHTFGKEYRFDLTEIKAPIIRNLYKRYLIENYKMGVPPNTLRSKKSALHRVFLFLHQQSILSLLDISSNTIDMLMVFLATTPTEATGRPLTYKNQYTAIQAFKDFITWAQIHAPEMVPKEDVFFAAKYSRVNQRHKIDYYSDDLMCQIKAELKDESNLYVKAFLNISLHTGLRISDMLNLEIDCVQDGLLQGKELKYFNHKKREWGTPIPIPPICCNAIAQLIEYTSAFRDEAPPGCQNKLFIHKIEKDMPFCNKGDIRVVTDKGIESWIDKFVEKHNIVDTSGNPLVLRCHQMRRSVGTNLIASGVNPTVVKEILDHVDLKTTDQYYIGEVNQARAETTRKLGVIGNIKDLSDEMFASQQEKEWFFEHSKTKACLCDGYCTKQMSSPDDMCDTLKNRNKCFFCVKYVTTPEFLDVHKSYLNNLKKQVEDGKALYGIHYEEHFSKTIAVLEDIVAALTKMRTDRKVTDAF